jgi:pyruvate dehydrogenase E2 component (dihydrolipoamide acetyltransferase)
VLAKIVVPEGTQDVSVNALIAVLAQEGEDPKAAAAAAGKGAAAAASRPAEPQARPASTGIPSPQRGEGVAPSSLQRGSDPNQVAVATAPPQAQRAPSPHPKSDISDFGPSQVPNSGEPEFGRGEGRGEGARANGGGTNRLFASPLARRLAKTAGIDLSLIHGSGPHGRVIARDVEAAKSGGGLKAAGPAPMAAPAPTIAPSLSDQQIRALYEDGSYQVIPHDGMRRTIAQRLTASVQTIPHFYLTIDCNIGKLLEAREEINVAAPKDNDGTPAYKLSVNDFVIKALALALQRVPDANVSWTDGGMLKHKHSDVGVAVAMPGGLITPIIRSAEAKSLSVISNEMKDFAARARARKLKPHEYQGGTTAVSNLGMYGIKDFTAVINPPHATILAVGAGEERAIVKHGKIEAAQIMSVTMSCDHRAVDGALGAQLIGAFKTLIENPVMMVV